jgi:hypothetical protein
MGAHLLSQGMLLFWGAWLTAVAVVSWGGAVVSWGGDLHIYVAVFRKLNIISEDRKKEQAAEVEKIASSYKKRYLQLLWKLRKRNDS